MNAKITKTKGKRPSLDEIVVEESPGSGIFFHLEKMSDKHWWLAIYAENKNIVVNLKSKSPITTEVFEESVY